MLYIHIDLILENSTNSSHDTIFAHEKQIESKDGPIETPQYIIRTSENF